MSTSPRPAHLRHLCPLPWQPCLSALCTPPQAAYGCHSQRRTICLCCRRHHSPRGSCPPGHRWGQCWLARPQPGQPRDMGAATSQAALPAPVGAPLEATLKTGREGATWLWPSPSDGSAGAKVHQGNRTGRPGWDSDSQHPGVGSQLFSVQAVAVASHTPVGWVSAVRGFWGDGGDPPWEGLTLSPSFPLCGAHR